MHFSECTRAGRRIFGAAGSKADAGVGSETLKIMTLIAHTLTFIHFTFITSDTGALYVHTNHLMKESQCSGIEIKKEACS